MREDYNPTREERPAIKEGSAYLIKLAMHVVLLACMSMATFVFYNAIESST